MSRLSMVEEKLPPGFRFHPRDDELVCDYLLKKMNGCDESSLFIDVDLNKCEPWDIPETACVGGKEWYFYSQRDKKYATGLRTNRATISGYWKATGKDRPIARKESLIGMRKTLVFYQGRAPKGKKTDWVMHEFRLEGPFGPSKNSTFKEDWVLCRVFYKNKEVPAKSGINESNTTTLQEETGSSSLPALMDTYITFDQTQTEQVPCFSIFPGFNNQQNNPTPTYFPLDPNNMRSTATVNFGSGGFTQENVNEITNLLSNPWSCDKKVIEAMLSHLTKIESSPKPNIKGSPSLGEASCESYLSEAGLPTVWNHY